MGTERAERIIEFIQTLKQPDGKNAGKPMILADWQREIIHQVYAPEDAEGGRLVRQAVLSVARKNGKTSLIAGLTLAHLCGPEAIRNGQLYSVAYDRSQAAIIHKLASAMIRMDPELSAILNVVDTHKKISHPESGSVYTALSAEVKAKHGFSSSFLIFDELSQFGADRELYDVMMTSTGAHGGQALSWVISTQAANDLALMSELIDYGRRIDQGMIDDPHFKSFVFEIPADADVWNEANWPLANPGLGSFRSLEEMRDFAAKARRMPSQEAAFRNLYCNQRIDAETPGIPLAAWKACAGKVDDDVFRGRKVYAGLDLSAKNDLTALVLVAADDDGVVHVKPFFWLPGDGLRDKEDRDRVPYTMWREKGFLFAPPGKTIDYRWVAREIGDLADDYDIDCIMFDRFKIHDLMRFFEIEGISAYIDDGKAAGSGVRFVECGQGFRDMSPCVEALEDLLLNGQLRHDSNPVLTWNASNAVIVADPSGNRKYAKNRAIGRMDGIVGLAMACKAAVARLSAEPEVEPRISWL